MSELLRRRFACALAVCGVLAAAGCATGGAGNALNSSEWHVAVFERNPPGGLDILQNARVIDLGEGCVGVSLDNEDRNLILAVPTRSSMDSSGAITVPRSTTGGPITFSVGDHITFTSAGIIPPSRESGNEVSIRYPEQCKDELETWLLLPSDVH